MKRPDNRTFLIIGVLIALTVGVLAVFFSSGDPDGLESTAQMVHGEKTLFGPSSAGGNHDEVVGTGSSVYASPFPDYSMGEAPGPMGGILATITGILVILILVFGAARFVARKKA